MNGERTLPAWRSLLFVPVTNERFVERAHERSADAVILDLEDSIAGSAKHAARQAAPKAAARIAAKGTPVLVRINNGPEAIRDLEWITGPDLAAVDIPKVGGAEELKRLDGCLSELELQRGLAEGQIRMKLVIETAEGLMNLREIADFCRECRRVFAVTLGNEDLAADMGIAPSPLNLVPLYQQMVIAARYAGVLSFGYADSVADYQDLARLRRAVRRARAIGLQGSSCIHPSHVPILKEGFAPDEEALRFARKVIEEARRAQEEQRGVFVVEGRMIDLPLIRQSERLLARAGQSTLPESGEP